MIRYFLNSAILWLFSFFLLLTPQFVSAQAQRFFKVVVTFKVDDGSVNGASAVVIKNGGSGITIPGQSRFDIDLDFNAEYVISFSKPGYITKKIAISTKIPEDRVKQDVEPVSFTVVLLKQYEGVNIVVFNQPVGHWYFNKKIDDFDFDTDYTKSIQSALDDAETALRQKKAEEKQKPKTDSKKDSTATAAKKPDDSTQKENAKNGSSNAPVTNESRTTSNPSGNQPLTDNNKNKGNAGESPGLANQPSGGEDKNKSSGNSSIGDPARGGTVGSGNDASKSLDGSSGEDKNKTLAASSGDDKLKPGSVATGNDAPAKNLSGSAGDDKQKNGSMNSGDDAGKNNLNKKQGEDKPPSVTITTAAKTDEQKFIPVTDNSTYIDREEINEDKRSILNVRVTVNGRTTLYTRVAYRWGGVFYFKDSNVSISESFFKLSVGSK